MKRMFGRLGLPVAMLVLSACGAVAATPDPVEPGWQVEAGLAVLLAVGAMVYATGTVRLWLRMRGDQALRGIRILSFAAGLGAVAAALLLPVPDPGVSDLPGSLSAYGLYFVIGAPLLVASRPLGPILWGLPISCRSLITALRGRLGMGCDP